MRSGIKKAGEAANASPQVNHTGAKTEQGLGLGIRFMIGSSRPIEVGAGCKSMADLC
jgi:hypothetical protein